MEKHLRIPQWQALYRLSIKIKTGIANLPDYKGRVTNLLTTLLGVTLLVLSHTSYGQGTIKGIIRDANGKGLPYVSTGLLAATDSKLVKGTLTNEAGAYEFNGVQKGDYVVAANMVGYASYTSGVIKVDGAATTLPGITLNQIDKTLKEVSVTTKRPFVEQQIDRMVVNVANSIISSGSTALEVLEKAPGVTVDRQNDAIALRGKEGVMVQIDGKQTYLGMADVVALLRTMPSDNIDRIELITNPSAKYDAAGNSGIIDIKLKKNNNLGTNGSASLGGGSGRFDRERGSLQINHRTKKLNFFGNYSATRGGNYFNLTTDQNLLEGDRRTLINQNTDLELREWGQNAKAGLDYFIGKNTSVGLVWTGLWSNNQEKGPASSLFRHEPNGPVYLRATTNKTQSSKLYNQVANLNFQHTFGAKGGQITADFDWGHFQRDFSNNLITETIRADDPLPDMEGLFNQMPTTIDISTIKTDYNRTLSDSWKMEAGLKQSFVRTDNDLTLRSGPLDKIEPDPSLSNHFQYTERVNAAYVSFNGKLAAKTELLAGLRAEHTSSLGHSLTFNQKVRRKYLNLFPSFFISRPINPNHALSLSYSRRINRPSYEMLNPARSYVDPFLFNQGNPYLQPQYTQALELKHGYKGEIFTSLGASYTNDVIFNVIRPVNNSTTERMATNIGKSQVYNLTLSFPVTVVKGWTLQTTLLGYYSQFQFTYLDKAREVQQASARLNGTSAFVLGKGWTAELTGWINSPRMYAMTRYPWRASIDTGLQKKISSRLNAKFTLQDIFHSNEHIGDIRTPDFNRYYLISMDTRVAMLNLTYAFGNQQLKSIRQRKTGSEEEMQRTN